MALSIPIISEFDGKGFARFKQELKQAETATEKAGLVLKKGLVPATAALGGLAIATKDVIGVASDLRESQDKINVIFGEGAKEIDKFAKTASKRIGQSRRSVLEAAGTFGAFGKAAGLSGKDLAEFSNDFTELASDLASFNNTSPEDAIQAIGAALRGEAEPMRRYNVLLDDATLKQAALELKIYDGTGALTAQEKILAAQKVIFDQTADAQGNFMDTSDGLANSSRTLTAQMDDLKGSIGEGLLPIVESVLPYLKDFAEWASDNPQMVRNMAAAVGALAAATVALNAAMAVNPYVAAAAGLVAMSLAFEKLYDKISKVNKVGGIAARVFGFIFGGPAGMAGTMMKLSDAIFDAILPDAPQKARGGVGGLGGGLMNELKGIPRMATGGIVHQPTLALIGESGSEAVIPLDKMGGMGGTTVNINVQGADPQAVVDALRTYMYRNGSVPIKIAS